MRRILLLGMAVLLGIAAHADDRQVIYEETFADGLGDCTIEQYGVAGWSYNAEGYVNTKHTTNNQTRESRLILPEIDLTNYHNPILTFDYMVKNHYGESYGDRIGVNLIIKVDNGSWQHLTECITYMGTNNRFYESPKYYLARFQGHKIQIAFQYHPYGGYTSSSEAFKNIKVSAYEGAESNEPVVVNSLDEFFALEEGTLGQFEFNNAITTWKTYFHTYAQNDEGGCSFWITNWNGDPGFDTGVHFSGTVTGIRGYNYGYREVWDAYITASSLQYPEDIENYTVLPFKAITEEQIADYDCQKVSLDLCNEDVVIFDECGTKFVAGQERLPGGATRVSGIVYLTPDQEKRIAIFYQSTFLSLLSEDEPYNYRKISRLSSDRCIQRPFKKDCWNTACFPFLIGTECANTLMDGNADYAIYTGTDNGVLVFEKYNFTSGEIPAGQPILIKPQEDYSELVLPNEAYLDDISGQFVVNGGDYNFVGTLEPVQPADGSYYLSANNTIRPLASGGTINAFRAYFEPATPNAAKARALSIDGVTTAIEDIVGGEELLGIPQRVYTVNGQYAGDDLEALPKGVYIVNGKKIIK